MTRDRQEDALNSLRLLRQGAYTEDEIEHEFREMQNALNNTVKKGSFMDMWRGSKLTPITNIWDMTFTDDLSESQTNFDHNRSQHLSSTHGSELCVQIWHNLYTKSELGQSFCYVMHQLCAQHCCCLLDTVLV